MKKHKKMRKLQLEWKQDRFSWRIPIQAGKPRSMTIAAPDFLLSECLCYQALNSLPENLQNAA
jgi:hypothetical protein